MAQPMRILILEDVASDAEVMAYELRQARLDFTWKRVEDEAGFLKELEKFEPDLILSDYSLPSFDGLEALALAQKKRPEAPFIFISGAMGEEVAVDALRRGATDYVLKGRLSRLAPAVERALQEAQDRQERRQAVQALRESEQNYRLLVKSIPAVVFKGYVDWSLDFLDDKVEELTGYSKEEFDSRKLKWSDLIIPEDLEEAKRIFLEGLKTTRSYTREYRIRKKDGQALWIQARGQIVCDDQGKVEYVSGVFFDITERKHAEEALRQASLHTRSLIEASLDPLVTISPKGKIMDVNRATEMVTGVARDDLIGQDFSDYFTEPEKARQAYQLAFSQGMVKDYPLTMRHVSGRVTDVLYNATIYKDEAGAVQGVFAAARDITERKKFEEALRESEQRLRFLSNQLLSAQEGERKRVSMELHDELGQSLTVLKLQIRNIEKELGQDQQSLREDCQYLLGYLDEVINNVRRLSRDLSPAILEDLGLMSALKYLISEFDKHYEVSYSFTPENLNDLFTQEEQIIVYRIFQELLTNIYKHAQATRVAIVIREWAGHVFLMVEDNGAGFDVAQVLARDATERGLGLAALDERARMLGGFLEIWSLAGVGTRITCHIPLENTRKL